MTLFFGVTIRYYRLKKLISNIFYCFTNCYLFIFYIVKFIIKSRVLQKGYMIVMFSNKNEKCILFEPIILLKCLSFNRYL